MPQKDLEAGNSSQQSESKRVHKHNPLLAIGLNLLSVLSYALSKLLSKLLFIWVPDMDAFLQLTLRMIISVSVLLI